MNSFSAYSKIVRSLIEISKPIQGQQTNNKDDNLSNRQIRSHSKDKTDKQDQNIVVETDKGQKKVYRNSPNKNWWHF
ncbi:MAG: hypothetical protein L0G13_05350 [Lactococcus lactis]|nr:hypothetical protein [Lactococcus lactis]